MFYRSFARFTNEACNNLLTSSINKRLIENRKPLYNFKLAKYNNFAGSAQSSICIKRYFSLDSQNKIKEELKEQISSSVQNIREKMSKQSLGVNTDKIEQHEAYLGISKKILLSINRTQS